MKYFLFLLIVVIINGCEILPPIKGTELYSIQPNTKTSTIRVMYYPSNATMQASIQVQKIVKDNIEVLKDYERYNYMDTCGLIDDTTLLLIIRDTISVLENKPDTMKINIK